jgi:membrane peptidoglycan carboxypeptidase
MNLFRHHFSRHLFARNRRRLIIGLGILITVFILIIGARVVAGDAQKEYDALLSAVVYDRADRAIGVKENAKGHYVLPLSDLPSEFANLLIKKEDRFFYYHPGVNPISLFRALVKQISTGHAGGSSTLTQQLAKNLLHHESDRTVANKITETAYALGLEIFYSKEDLLLMYANTVYLGNQVQGFETASLAYFNKPLRETTVNEQIALLATLSHPSTRNPWREENSAYAENIAEHLAPDQTFFSPEITQKISFQDDSLFELQTAGLDCEKSCQSTIDSTLTNTLRNILEKHIKVGQENNIKNGAIVVIRPDNAELLALVGSPNPKLSTDGQQINMALAPRPIGSTIKPFIYGKGFAEGLRPYTVVEDREYKYPIATGFSLYPKNYDGQYRGQVTLHEALSNSLNVPSVKILEYIGLTNFYAFLENQMRFKPIQDYDSYQYGIALGGLEMDLLTLTHYFSIFSNQGKLIPLKILVDSAENYNLPPQSDVSKIISVLDPAYVELVNSILQDRYSGVNQFGLKNNLNLPIKDYGVKTGTSRDYHDSWVIGYTPDFVVGVWLGNAENTALAQVSGQAGAGAVWQTVMEFLLTTPYVTAKTFSTDHLENFTVDGNTEWGLTGDNIAKHRNLLQENLLITSLHQGDVFEYTPQSIIPLRSSQIVEWQINGELFNTSQETSFQPDSPGTYEITATSVENDRFERIMIEVTEPQ